MDISPDATLAKCSCQHCGQPLQFPLELAGIATQCPGCQQWTWLQVGESAPMAGAEITPEVALNSPASTLVTGDDFLKGFAGSVPRTPVSFVYQLGLLIVTATMVLLPLVYLALVGLAGWGVYYWATHFTFLLKSTAGGLYFHLIKMVFYITPLFAGVVLTFFLIKPLFARMPKAAQPLALNPEAEPLLFEFVARICDGVRAPRPKRIDLVCDLNAAAGFRRGAWSLFGNDLVLTIGLPLAAGLTVGQFAGVFAHEFGHFTQGIGMRLTYVIRRINGWFARLVYERDAWDEALEEWGETESGWALFVISIAQLGVAISRLILQMLMLAGHGIGCFMLRQMEYDADSYEIKMGGSQTFEETTRRMHVLGSLLDKAYKQMRIGWNLNRQLPEDFPAYLMCIDQQLPEEARTQLEDTMGLEPTGLFHTHPSNGDRIRRARQANEAGIFHRDAPARALFSNFEVPCKHVTMLHYADDMGVELALTKLVPAAIAAGSSMSSEAVPASENSAPGRPKRKLKVPMRSTM